MENRPKSLQAVIPEWALIKDLLGEELTKSGRLRVVSSWVREGLKCLKMGERRFFLESDLIEFLCDRYSLQNGNGKSESGEV